MNKIALVLSTFNEDISARLKKGAMDELHLQGVEDFRLVEVPGVVEIALTAQWLFQKNWEAVIALGSVIRGETSHYEACCQLVQIGCTKVQLKMNRPIVFGVLMTDNKEQALARTGGKKTHIARACVRTAMQMLALKEKLSKENLQNEMV